MLVITPDYNSPRDPDGGRTEIVRSRYIVESVENGDISVGDSIFIYFDPEGTPDFEYEAGWGATGTIISVYTKEIPENNEKITVIRFRDDYS